MNKQEQAARAFASIGNVMRLGRIRRRDFLRRSSGLLLCALLTASMLVACGPTAAPPTAEPTKPPEATKAPEPAELSGELVWQAQETTSREEHFEGFPDSIELVRVVYTDQPALLQQLRVGSQEADVIQISPLHAPWAREFDLVQPIDVSRLKNWDKVLPGFQDLEEIRNENGEIDVIPQFWGTDGIAYNADVVTAEEASTWSILWSDKYAGKTAMRNEAQEGLALVGIYLGHENPWNQTTEELAESLAFLKENKSQFRTFWNTLADVEALFLNGEVVASHSWFPIVKQLNDQGMNIKWSHPKEGAIGFMEGQSIAKDTSGEKLDLAYAFLDYILSDEYYKSFYDGTGYRYTTDTQFDYLSQEEIEYLGLSNMDELISTLYMWEHTPNMEEYQEVWTEFLAY